MAPLPAWVADFSAACARLLKGQVELLATLSSPPLVQVEGALRLHSCWTPRVERAKHDLIACGYANETHLVLCRAPRWQADALILSTRTLDFAQICALRAKGLAPALLSSACLLDCPERQCLIVQRRAAHLATHPGCLHVFGGALDPQQDIVPHGQPCLLRTLERELREETGLQTTAGPGPFFLLRETGNGFVQLLAPARTVRAADLDQWRDNWEGMHILLPYPDLPQCFMHAQEWVPTGLAHLLRWQASPRISYDAADPESFGNIHVQSGSAD